MIIQCPECKSRYRARNYRPDQPAVRVKCPKCTHVFLFEPSSVSIAPPQKEQTATAVLIIDDARFFREILIELLAPLQLELVTVGTAADALNMLRQQAFQLVLVDLNLPDMNGLELMREICADDSLKHLKLLAMSGAYRKDDCEVDAIRAGADGFLNKSFKPDELLQRIRTLLEQ